MEVFPINIAAPSDYETVLDFPDKFYEIVTIITQAADGDADLYISVFF